MSRGKLTYTGVAFGLAWCGHIRLRWRSPVTLSGGAVTHFTLWPPVTATGSGGESISKSATERAHLNKCMGETPIASTRFPLSCHEIHPQEDWTAAWRSPRGHLRLSASEIDAVEKCRRNTLQRNDSMTELGFRLQPAFRRSQQKQKTNKTKERT